MVRHWNRELRDATTPAERRRIHRARAINAFGACFTGIVLVVVMVTKFTHGAYIVVFAMPVLVGLMYLIHRHYLAVRAELDVEEDDDETLPSRVHAIVLVSGWTRPLGAQCNSPALPGPIPSPRSPSMSTMPKPVR
jgi:hypothetical protein